MWWMPSPIDDDPRSLMIIEATLDCEQTRPALRLRFWN